MSFSALSSFFTKLAVRRPTLAGLRFIVTMPPAHFFGGVERRRALDQARALSALGAALYPFETSRIYRDDRLDLRDELANMRAFGADAVIGAQHAGYALQGAMVRDGPDSSKNLFLDILELPTLLYWDQALTQASRYLIQPWPETPSDSRSGALAKLRALMRHPLAVHFFPDSGHKAEFDRLGLSVPTPASVFVTAVSDDFVTYGRSQRAVEPKDRLAFFGNIYVAAEKHVTYAAAPSLLAIRQAALTACKEDWDLPAGTAYYKAIVSAGDLKRAELKLDPDESFHWRFLFDELSVVANGPHRLALLSAAQGPIAFYGGFADIESAALLHEKGWIVRNPLPHDETLARAFRATQLTLDVVNAPFINGFSPKLLECFASGGFMLTTRKSDMKAAFGGLADLIGYSNPEELNAKIDYYLSHSRERRQVMREMQWIIRKNYTAAALFARTVPAALEQRR